MTEKVISVTPEVSLSVVGETLRENRIRHLPVLGAKKKLRGLISSRNMLLAHNAPRNQAGERLAGHIMTRKVMTVTPNTCLCVVGQMLFEKKIGCAPVVDKKGHLLGIITESDFVRITVQGHECTGAPDQGAESK